MIRTDKERAEIDYVSKIDDIYIQDKFGHQTIDPMPKVILKRKTLERYQDVLNKDKSFWYRVGQFLKAENEAGRKAKIVKDFALMFVPYGEQVEDVTEFVSDILIEDANKQQQKEEADMNWLINRAQEQSTWRGIIVFITSATALSVSPELQEAVIGFGTALFILVEVVVKEAQSDDA